MFWHRVVQGAFSADTMDQGTRDSAPGQSTSSVTDSCVVKLKLPWPVKEEPPDQPSAVYSTVQPMPDNSVSLLSQKTCLACHLCSAVFMLSNSLKVHMETFHGETLHREVPVAPRPHDSAGENTDQMPSGQGGISAQMTEDSREDSVTSANDFVVKLESPWSMKEEPQDQPSAVCSTVQPMSDNTSGSLLSQNTGPVCQRCSATFVLFSSLELHMVTLHGETLQDWFPMYSAYKCNSVGYHHGCKTESVSDRNKRAKERRKEKVEDNCSGRTDQEERSRKHVCDVCGKAFLRAIHLKEHKLLHTGRKPFVCDVCSKAFARRATLKRHKLIHAVHKPFVCDVCSKAFAHPAKLKRHKKTHTDPPLKSYVCDVCNEAFTRYPALKHHKVIHKDRKSFVCDVCRKSFTRPDTLKQHKSIHTGQKPFVCDVCSQAFIYANTLKRHKISHTGHKPFVCDVCTKAFSLSSVFKRHKLLHAGHKPFVCDVCSKAFSCSSALTCHKLVHTGLKSFVCDVCSKGFTQSRALKLHKLIHTDYKSFVCDVCSKAFTRAGNLKAHKLIHTGCKPFACDVCSKTFTWSGALKRHKRVHTEEETRNVRIVTLV